MNNSEVAELGMFIWRLEKSYKERRTREKDDTLVADWGVDRDYEDSDEIVYSDIYRRAMIAEFLRGK